MLLRRQHRQGDRTGPEPDTAPPSEPEPDTNDAPSDTKPTGRSSTRKRAKE